MVLLCMALLEEPFEAPFKSVAQMRTAGRVAQVKHSHRYSAPSQAWVRKTLLHFYTHNSDV